MLKNGLIGLALLLVGLAIILMDFHLYVTFGGAALILIATFFLRNFRNEMNKKTMAFIEKKRLENIKKKNASKDS